MKGTIIYKTDDNSITFLHYEKQTEEFLVKYIPGYIKSGGDHLMVCFNRGVDYTGQASQIMINHMLQEVNGLDIYENEYEKIKERFDVTKEDIEHYRDLFKKRDFLIDWKQVSQDIKDNKM